MPVIDQRRRRLGIAAGTALLTLTVMRLFRPRSHRGRSGHLRHRAGCRDHVEQPLREGLPPARSGCQSSAERDPGRHHPVPDTGLHGPGDDVCRHHAHRCERSDLPSLAQLQHGPLTAAASCRSPAPRRVRGTLFGAGLRQWTGSGRTVARSPYARLRMSATSRAVLSRCSRAIRTTSPMSSAGMIAFTGSSSVSWTMEA